MFRADTASGRACPDNKACKLRAADPNATSAFEGLAVDGVEEPRSWRGRAYKAEHAKALEGTAERDRRHSGIL